MARHLKGLLLLVAAITVTGIAACAQPAAPPTTAPTPTAAAAAAPTTAPTPTPAAGPATPTTAPTTAAAKPTAAPTAAVTSAATPAAAATPQPTAAAKPTAAAAAAPTPTPLSRDQLSAIQPGLGTVMIEYGRRMASVWFAGQAGNWDLASYQLDEMREIQEVGETTRPARAPALKSFESSFLDPLDKAISTKDKAGFQTAYTSAIQGCNACHGSQTSSAFPQGYKFIRVQVPSKSIWDIYDWKGQ